MKRILFISILIISLTSCSRSIECMDPPIYLSFISLPQNALDTFVIRKFTRNDNFQNLLDTLQVTSRIGYIANHGDTLDVNLGSPYHYPKPGFDWQIFIPAINRTVTITDINKRDKTGKCSPFQIGCGCDDEILSLKVNNQTGVLQTKYRYNLFIR